MIHRTVRMFLALWIALLGGTAIAQDTIGTTAVGTTNYPTCGYEFVSAVMYPAWRQTKDSALDTSHNVIYALQEASMAKVPLPLGSAATQTVEFTQTDDVARDLDVDSAAGYIYVVANRRVIVFSRGGRGEKPTRLGSLDLGSSDWGATSVTVDSRTGDLYVGTLGLNQGPGRIVRYRRGSGSGLPVFVGEVRLNTSEIIVTHGFIDSASGYGVFLANSNSYTTYSRLIKISLQGPGGSLERLSSITFSAPRTFNALVGNTQSDTCYLSRHTSQRKGEVVKFNVSGAVPEEVGTYTTSDLSGDRDQFFALGTDLSGEHIIAACDFKPGEALRKIATATMTEVGTMSGESWAGTFVAGVFNPSTNRAHVIMGDTYLYSFSRDNRVLELDSGAGAAIPTLLSIQGLPQVYEKLGTVAVDRQTGHAFVTGTSTIENTISKVGYFSGQTKAPEISNTYSQDSTGIGYPRLEFDPIRRKLYRLSAASNSSAIDKFEPGSGGNLPVLTSTLQFSVGSWAAAFDFEDNFAYVGRSSIAKVRLGAGTDAPTVASTMAPGPTFGDLQSLAIDKLHGKLYGGCVGSNKFIAKFSLGAGDAPPVLDGVLTNFSTDQVSQFIALDPEDGYGLLLLKTPAGRFVRFSVDGTNNPPVITGVFDFPQIAGLDYFDNPTTAYLDAAEDSLLLARGTRIHRIDTGGASGTMTYRSATLLDQGRFAANIIVPSGTDEFLVGTGGDQAGLLKLAKAPPSMKGRARALLVSTPVPTTFQDVRFYSHAAKGNLGFAIYNAARIRIWYSPPIKNNTANGEIVVPIASGTPPVLTVPAGSYYLGFCSDSDSAVASRVSQPGTSIAFPWDSFPLQDIQYTSPPYEAENWSIHATVQRPPVLTSIQIFDGDGVNAPLVGFTNSRNILIVTGFNSDVPEFLEISDDGFATSTIQPYAQTLPFIITRKTDGAFIIRCRGLSASGTSNVGWYDGTFDTLGPAPSLQVVDYGSGYTSSPTKTLRLTMSEPLNYPPDPENSAQFELTNCSLGQAVLISPNVYEFQITHIQNGPVNIFVPPGALSDRAGNITTQSANVSYTYDSIPPSVSLSTPLFVTGPAGVPGSYATFDAGSHSVSLYLYSRRSDGVWNQEFMTLMPGKKFVFFPRDGIGGTYELLLRATDDAGNANIPIPTGTTGSGTTLMHYNPTPNAAVTSPVAGSGSYFFAMENDVLVRIDLSNVSGSGTLTVSREEGDLGPFAGTGQMIEERLNIAYAGFTFGDATLETFYEDENLGGLHESSIVTAARVRGASEPTFFPITHDPSWNRITIHGITNLRDTWYFGRVPSPAANWAIYE